MPAVGEPFGGIDVEAGGDAAVGPERDLKGTEDRRGPRRPLLPAVPWRELEKRTARQVRHAVAEVGVLGDLRLDRRPAAFPGKFLEPRQQDRLADPAQAGDQHRLFGVAAEQSCQQDPNA